MYYYEGLISRSVISNKLLGQVGLDPGTIYFDIFNQVNLKSLNQTRPRGSEDFETSLDETLCIDISLDIGSRGSTNPKLTREKNHR